MFYKLSNIASIDSIESAFGATFRFPNLHTRDVLIDGLNEEIVPIIRANTQHQIDYGVWGLLPTDYKEDWDVFQKVTNTLNFDVDKIKSEPWLNDALKNRRCVVLITGFFSSYEYDGKVYPVYIHADPLKPIAAAGIYNITDDGFYSFSLVMVKSEGYVKNLHNVSETLPIIMDETNFDMWFDDTDYQIILNKPSVGIENIKFDAHTIAKEFYKHNIVFDGSLEPAAYRELLKNT